MYDLEDKTPEEMTPYECLYAANEAAFDYNSRIYIPNEESQYLRKLAFNKLHVDIARTPENELLYAKCLIDGIGCKRDVFQGLELLKKCADEIFFPLAIRAQAHENLSLRYMNNDCLPKHYGNAYFHILCSQYLNTFNGCKALMEQHKIYILNLESSLTEKVVSQTQEELYSYFNLK